MSQAINELDDRAAMGLPQRFVGPAVDTEEALQRHPDLLDLTPVDLAVVVESDAPFGRRLAAGRLLAQLGDPRVSVFEPAMIALPGGTMTMGLDWDEVDLVVDRWRHTGVQRDWILKECPAYRVTVPAFRLMTYPVTNAEYRTFLEDSGHDQLPTSWSFGGFPAERANHPVYTVTPQDAEAYAAWVSARTGRRFRLPREAEWEYAAHRDGREFPWGDEWEPARANTVESRLLATTPVGLFPGGASPFGVLDLAGNVEEYVADDYAPYPGGVLVADDLLVALGRYRIARGGSFTRFGDLARCRRRHGCYPRTLYAVGFRLAEDRS